MLALETTHCLDMKHSIPYGRAFSLEALQSHAGRAGKPCLLNSLNRLHCKLHVIVHIDMTAATPFNECLRDILQPELDMLCRVKCS